MSEEAPVIDKRTVVRVGLPSRSSLSIASVIKPSQPPTISTSEHFQYIKMPLSERDLSGPGDDEDSENTRRRQIISKPPSHFRKLYNDIATNHPSSGYKIEDDSSDGQMTQDSNDATEDQSSSLGNTYQIVSQDDSADDGLQSLTIKNLSNNVPTSGATIVQYTQGPDGQLFIPVHQLNASGLVFPPGLMVSAASSGVGSPQMGIEETCKKRELRLLKNKEAAKECRRKKKEYVKCLENRVAVLENQNKTLIEELKSLKELYCQKDIHS
jgi:hypothetical protein